MNRKIWILCIIAILFCGCTLNPPEKTIVLNVVAQNAGFLLAQEKPELAQDVLEYSEVFLDNEIFGKSDFHKWVSFVIDKLELNPFLQMNFKEMIKLVNIKIELSEDDGEILELLYQVIQNFVVGIETRR